MIIREITEKDIPQVQRVVKALHPKWFDKNALVNIPKDIQLSKGYVAIEDKEILGFISFYSQDGEARISWMGVSPDKHKKGIGRQLLNKVESHLLEMGINIVRVETVVEQSPEDSTYDQTMKFYTAVGFQVEKKYKQEHFKQFTFRKGMLKKILSKKTT